MSKGLERSIARGGLFNMTPGVKIATGKISADNKPIFREVFLLGDTAAGVDQSLAMIGVIDTLVTAYGGSKNVAGVGYTIPRPEAIADTLDVTLTVEADGEDVNVITGAAAELQGGYIVVEYTE